MECRLIFSLPQVGKGKARTALSLVGYDDELRPAMEYVFGSTMVCDSLDSAKKVRVVDIPCTKHF